VTFISFGEMTADSPPRWRSLISRMRATMSASIWSNSSWLISSSSRRICASSRRSRSTLSSFSSVSTAAAILSSTKRTPERIRLSMISTVSTPNAECRMLKRHLSMGAFELEADVDEVVRRPGTGVLEGQLLVLLPDLLDPRVERLLHLARDEKGGVHDHAVADRLVRARGDRDVPQRGEDLGDVALGPGLQRRVDEAAVLHAGEIRRPLLGRDLALQAADVLVLVLDLADDLVAVPQHLEAELELLLHLAQHVAERVVGRSQQLHDVVVGLEHRAERHRDDGVLLHHRFVDALVGEHVLAGRVLDDDRRVVHDRGDVAEVDRVDFGRFRPQPQRAEAQRLLGADDAVDVLAFGAVFAPRRWHLDPFELAAGGFLLRRCLGGGRVVLLLLEGACRRGFLSRGRLLAGLLCCLRHACDSALHDRFFEAFGVRAPSLAFSAFGRCRSSSRLISVTRASGRHGLVTKASHPASRAPSAWPARAWPV